MYSRLYCSMIMVFTDSSQLKTSLTSKSNKRKAVYLIKNAFILKMIDRFYNHSFKIEKTSLTMMSPIRL
jgi:hypothetical protein